MIYLLNNIRFGHPKLNKHQIAWFETYFIPLISKKGGDKIVIKGDLFYNNRHITFELLSKVIKILSSITIPIEIIGNDYCYDIISNLCTKIENDEYNISNLSLFQFSNEDDSEIGFYLIKDKIIFVPNKQTPKFIEYRIEAIEDFENVIVSKDFINIIVNSDLLDNQQSKNKIDLFLNNNPTINVYYSSNDEKQEKKVILDSKNINIRNILINNIEDELKTELNEIFDIYDAKK